jgi:putrescine aminotransferase
VDADSRYAHVVDLYAKHLNPALGRLMAFAGFGLESHAEGCYLYDHEGQKFLDCLGGYGCFSLGHRHPKVVEAVKNQLDSMGLGSKAFFSEPGALLAERLSQVAPSGLEYAFFCNSGAEAVEAALKIAKGVTGRSKIVSTTGSYHGKTLGALATTGRDKYRTRFEPLMPGVEFIAFGDSQAAANAIDPCTAAMIIEPIQGEGGIIVPPDGYLRDLRAFCDRNGALLIVDEVQTLFGRTGYWFGSNHDDVSPDLMPLAKALGGGILPVGAVLGTASLWESMFSENPLSHTSTFGGNPLACVAGLTTIQVIEEEGLVERSRDMGTLLLCGLDEMATKHHDLVLEARGRGLMLGLEFREDEVGELVVAQLLKRGMIVAYTLNNPRVLRFEPPLIITPDQIHFAINALDEALTETKELLALLL